MNRGAVHLLELDRATVHRGPQVALDALDLTIRSVGIPRSSARTATASPR